MGRRIFIERKAVLELNSKENNKVKILLNLHKKTEQHRDEWQ